MPELDLRSFWFAVAVHLWQSTLVLLVVFLLSGLLRRAPARLQHLLWSLALLKFFLPLQFLGGLLPDLAGSGVSGSLNLEGLMAPAILVVSAADALPGWRDPYALVSLVWLAGTIGLLSFWVNKSLAGRRERQTPYHRGPIPRKLELAIAGSGIPLESISLVEGRRMPCVTGLLRPTIVLASELIEKLETAQLRSILLHEDAHRRRRDPLLGLFQRIAFLVFYYHPLVWPLMRRLHATREMACDEHVLARGASREVYETALARTVGHCLAPAISVPAAACRSGSLFARRMANIAAWRGRNVTVRQTLVLAVAALVVMVGSFSPFESIVASDVQTGNKQSKKQVEPPSKPLLPGEDGVTLPKRIEESYVRPAYPAKAREERVMGRVILQATITEDGSVTDVSVLSCNRPGFGFEDAAKKSVRRWRYDPATKDGKPVAVYFSIRIEFKLR